MSVAPQTDVVDRIAASVSSRNPLHSVWRLLWASVWLVFLGYPIGDILSGSYSTTRAVLAWCALVVFALVYLSAMWIAMSTVPRDVRGARLLPLVLLYVLGVTLTIVFGGNWPGVLVYCGVLAGWTVGVRTLLVLLLGLVAFIVAGGHLQGQTWADVGFLAFLTFALGLTMFFFRHLVRLVLELRTAREQIARLAVSDERLRFARDLHDLLGHSLSVIALKAQVARRLLQQDSAAAEAALADVESVAHEALQEVREVVSELRRRSLEQELDSAREVLAAAGIGVTVQRDVVALSPSADALFAWTLREAVTNVLRHSHAHAVAIWLGARDGTLAIEISDDGQGGGDTSGSGLRGLRERLAAAGGRLDAGNGTGGGFRVRASVPQAT